MTSLFRNDLRRDISGLVPRLLKLVRMSAADYPASAIPGRDR